MSYQETACVTLQGRTLRAVQVARISTVHQDERRLDDQLAKCRRWLREHYLGQV